jgi:hypothetical protein
MSDEKKYSERDMVMARRQGFVTGIHEFYSHRDVPRHLSYVTDDAERKAARVYPLPTVTRPREHVDKDGYRWRCVDGRLESKSSRYAEWSCDDSCLVRPSDALALADLLANPTETVEDDV